MWVCFCMMMRYHVSSFFFFNDTATTEIYTLSLHDALPILYIHPQFYLAECGLSLWFNCCVGIGMGFSFHRTDRKSTRLNSSHSQISYAVFCLKKTRAYAPTTSLPP